MWNYEVRQRVGQSKVLPQWVVFKESDTGWEAVCFAYSKMGGRLIVDRLKGEGRESKGGEKVVNKR